LNYPGRRLASLQRLDSDAGAIDEPTTPSPGTVIAGR
jgi:hypothetical protein